MTVHKIGKNYINKVCAPGFESGRLYASVDKIFVEKTHSLEDQRQILWSSVRMHASVESPDVYESFLLEVELHRNIVISAISSSEKVEESDIYLPDESSPLSNGNVNEGESGIGFIRVQQPTPLLHLDAIFEPPQYAEVEDFLLKSYFDRGLQISLEASVLGMGRGCEWDVDRGPLLVKGITFRVDSKKSTS